MNVHAWVHSFQPAQTLATLNLETVKASTIVREERVGRVSWKTGPLRLCPTGKKWTNERHSFDYYMSIWSMPQRLTGMLTTTMSPSVGSREARDHCRIYECRTPPPPWFNACPYKSPGQTMSFFYQRHWRYVTGCCWLFVWTKLIAKRRCDAVQAETPLANFVTKMEAFFVWFFFLCFFFIPLFLFYFFAGFQLQTQRSDNASVNLFGLAFFHFDCWTRKWQI